MAPPVEKFLHTWNEMMDLIQWVLLPPAGSLLPVLRSSRRALCIHRQLQWLLHWAGRKQHGCRVSAAAQWDHRRLWRGTSDVSPRPPVAAEFDRLMVTTITSLRSWWTKSATGTLRRSRLLAVRTWLQSDWFPQLLPRCKCTCYI